MPPPESTDRPSRERAPDEGAAVPSSGVSGHEGDSLTESPEDQNARPRREYDPLLMQCEATQLMTDARSGRAEAFEALFEKVRGNAFHAARSLVGSYEDAQDLTQEAFVKAYKARDSYDPAQPFLPWFHRILRNTCFSFLRKRGRLRERSIHQTGNATDGDNDTWDIVDVKVPAPSDGIEAKERNAAFAGALDNLSARDREIIVLRHYQELSYKEIALALSIPEGTVMSRLFHARKRLRTLLASEVNDLVDTPGGPSKPAPRRRGAPR